MRLAGYQDMQDYYATREWPKSSTHRLRRALLGSWGRSEPLWGERLEFLGAFLRRPVCVGSVMPSSAALSQQVVNGCNLKAAATVVELGPGTGAITRFILEAMGEETLLLALELDERNANGLRRRFPGLKVYNDTAERMQMYLARHGRKKADCVISGLPWGNMGRKCQKDILAAVRRGLRAGGVFTAIAYWHAVWLPPYRHFRQQLERHFTRVSVSPIVWRNVPPAVVYRCR